MRYMCRHIETTCRDCGKKQSIVLIGAVIEIDDAAIVPYVLAWVKHGDEPAFFEDLGEKPIGLPSPWMHSVADSGPLVRKYGVCWCDPPSDYNLMGELNILGE